MSLGGSFSTTLNNAVNNAVSDGLIVTVAAGNEQQDACNVSPASAEEAFTVGSSTSTDARSSFSNFGDCVHITAPGTSIEGAWHTSDTASVTISGTSMATPHVAGAAALLLQQDPTASVDKLKAELSAAMTPMVGLPGGGLLFVGDGTDAPTSVPTPAPPPPDPSKYKIGQDQTNVCPPDSVHIVEAWACQMAAAAFGLAWKGTESDASYPMGCYRWNLESVYYNFSPGRARELASPICSVIDSVTPAPPVPTPTPAPTATPTLAPTPEREEATPVPTVSPSPTPTIPSPPTVPGYQIAPGGSNSCEGGSTKITVISDCEAAAVALGYKWSGTESTSRYPNGCYRWRSRRVYYNHHDGNGRRNSYPICAIERERAPTPPPSPSPPSECGHGWACQRGKLDRNRGAGLPRYENSPEFTIESTDSETNLKNYIYCQLNGPARKSVADFDLKLLKKVTRASGSVYWRTIGSSQSIGNRESIRVRRKAGTYVCAAVAFRGKGEYKMRWKTSQDKHRPPAKWQED